MYGRAESTRQEDAGHEGGTRHRGLTDLRVMDLETQFRKAPGITGCGDASIGTCVARAEGLIEPAEEVFPFVLAIPQIHGVIAQESTRLADFPQIVGHLQSRA
jgi:hypothetical protein